ncbi:MAG: NADH-quinone oxidoreductase subunit C [Bacteroidia bacterium]|nr:NADH-quinone oxidoreductase subunit C [Bacteroidia bacterium]MDW8089611.1 NADH-quinone oxidoreductase subunit C [Bacteroidia bacterium]
MEAQSGFWYIALYAPPLWPELAAFLRQEGQVDTFICLTATHEPPRFRLRYDLRSVLEGVDVAVGFTVPEEEAVPSVAAIWKGAEWHEREAYDLVGVRFSGHPDLRRLLLPKDWEGHPLRKDYTFPQTYHGISLQYHPPSATL